MLKFEQFYLNTRAIVRQYLEQHAGNSYEAEDIEQEAYLVALEDWERVKEHPNPAGWLMVTARHLCTGYHRRIYYRMESLDEREEDIPYTEPAYEMVVMEDLLESIYGSKEQEIAKRFFLHGDSVEELAQDMGVSAGSFRTRVYRMRRRLKRYIESEGKVW